MASSPVGTTGRLRWAWETTGMSVLPWKRLIDHNILCTKTRDSIFLGKSGFDYEVSDTACKDLHLSPRPRSMGVYLDYEAGRVSFFDVTQKSHIYSFLREHFTGILFPYFYLHSGTKRLSLCSYFQSLIQNTTFVSFALLTKLKIQLNRIDCRVKLQLHPWNPDVLQSKMTTGEYWQRFLPTTVLFGFREDMLM